MKKTLCIIACIIFGFSTAAFSTSVTPPSGSEAVVAYGAGLAATDGAAPAIGTAITNGDFLTLTMNAGGNNALGFTITMTSTLIYTHSGASGLTVNSASISEGALTAATAGHNQLFSFVCNDLLDTSDATVLTAGDESSQTVTGSNVGVTCSYTNPQRAVLATDTAKIGITTAANTAMISGTYSNSITFGIADNS